MLKRELLLIEKELIEVKNELESNPNADLLYYSGQLESSVRFLKTGEELIAFEEEEQDPTVILGMKASGDGVVQSVVGFFFTGFLLAYEGLQNSGGSYSSSGKFIFKTV